MLIEWSPFDMSNKLLHPNSIIIYRCNVEQLATNFEFLLMNYFLFFFVRIATKRIYKNETWINVITWLCYFLY